MNLNLSWFDLSPSSGLSTVVRCFLFPFVFRELHTRVVGWIDGVCVYVLVGLWAVLYPVFVLNCEFLCMHFSEWTACSFVCVNQLCASLHVCVYVNCVFPCESIWTACFSVYMYVRMCMFCLVCKLNHSACEFACVYKWTRFSSVCTNCLPFNVWVKWVFLYKPLVYVQMYFYMCGNCHCMCMCGWTLCICICVVVNCMFSASTCILAIRSLLKCLYRVSRFSLHPIDRKFVEK